MSYPGPWVVKHRISELRGDADPWERPDEHWEVIDTDGRLLVYVSDPDLAELLRAAPEVLEERERLRALVAQQEASLVILRHAASPVSDDPNDVDPVLPCGCPMTATGGHRPSCWLFGAQEGP
jgi:hypothetical protein